MNVTVYLFGEFNQGYTQYPDNYTGTIFQSFYANAKSTTQVAIHREGNLMYYGYIRKLDGGHYIGFCVVINGLMLTKLDGLFSLFENTITNIITNGQLIHFNDQGNIVSKVEKLYMNREEIDLLTESFRNGFHNLRASLKSLPAVNYGVAKHSVMDFSIEDNLEDIIKSSHTNGFTFIYKSKDYNTAQLNSYKGTLARLNNEKSELAKKYEKLETEHNKTIKEQKQYRFVTILIILILGCGIGLLILNVNLNSTKTSLNNANETIITQKNSLNKKTSEIINISQQYQAEHSKRVQTENSLSRLNQIISDRQPFIIKSTSFNFTTGYLSFDYYGVINETIKLEVRAFGNEGDAYSNSESFYVNLGDNSSDIYLDRDLDRNEWYSFELLIDKKIIGGNRH